jgi:hypothetical protein
LRHAVFAVSDGNPTCALGLGTCTAVPRTWTKV